MDLFTDELHKEITQEYFYQDIVSVDLKKGDISGRESFELVTSAGTKFSMPISPETLNANGKFQYEHVNMVVQNVRKILRERK